LEFPKDASRPDREKPIQGRRHAGCSDRRLRSFSPFASLLKPQATQNSVDSAGEGVLGYVSIAELVKRLYRGGMLLTDERGKPRDFYFGIEDNMQPRSAQRAQHKGRMAA
jgi:hypothetical protein